MRTRPLIMISHASENLKLAEDLADALDAEELNVWLAARDIAIGSNFAEEISRTISSSDFLVVLLSPESLTSPHVKREVNLAITMGKKLLPVLSADVAGIMHELPYDWNYWLSLAQVVPLTDVKSTAAKIAATIHRDLPGSLPDPIAVAEIVDAVVVPNVVVGIPLATPPLEMVAPPDTEGNPIRILVVDDHPIFRLGVCDRVKGIGPHVLLVGEAADGFAAQSQAALLHPDIILMDLNMPGISGIETTRNIRREFPGIQVIILSASAEIEEINEVLQAGASGFLLKSVTGAELEEAILNVAKGGSVLSPTVTRRLLTEMKSPSPGSDELSGGELEILKMVVNGATNRTIGEKLTLNMRAVEAHISNIFMKLGVKNRDEAIDYAVRNNLIAALSPS